MVQIAANGIMLEYELSGPEDGQPMLLIHGLGAQLVRWPQGLLDRLAAAGFRLIRYDSRDVGLSTHMDGAPVPDLGEVTSAKAEGRPFDLPYTLSDLAADAAGLLAALGIDSAHVVGVSLGGMVAQVLAIEHPECVRSLCIVMSQSGNPEMPGSDPAALAKLAAVAPDPAVDREGFLRHQVELNRTLGSPLYPVPEADLRAFAAAAAERSYYPIGSARQLVASRGAADRRADLRDLDVPALVIHGAEDPLIKAVCGRDIADNIPGAWLLVLSGMGHDMPDPLHAVFTATITANADRA